MIGQIEAISALDWWREAGLDVLVDEEPRDWLRPAAKPRAVAQTLATAEPPTELATLWSWLRDSDSLPGTPGARLLPAGDPASGLMLLADMPDPADADAGSLISGEAGRLFDRMLAAIGRDRASIYLAAMAGAPVPSRELAAPPVIEAARRHVSLANPRIALLLGDAPSRALLGMGFAEARGRKHAVNVDGQTVSVIATFHPRFLLQRPALKAAAWADLRMALRELR